ERARPVVPRRRPGAHGHAGHGIQPADAALSPVGRHGRQLPRRLPKARMSHDIRAVLFDLDGTLIDSAPDLAGAANELRAAHGLPALPYENFRPMVGSGARGMVGVAFDLGPDDARFPSLRDDFLRRYEERLTRETQVFASVLPLLDALDRLGHPWGVVTNKAGRFTDPLVRSLGLHSRAITVI